jgi:hypothetical protein
MWQLILVAITAFACGAGFMLALCNIAGIDFSLGGNEKGGTSKSPSSDAKTPGMGENWTR